MNIDVRTFVEFAADVAFRKTVIRVGGPGEPWLLHEGTLVAHPPVEGDPQCIIVDPPDPLRR